MSKELIRNWLKSYMFAGNEPDTLETIVDYFSNYNIHLLHSRPLFWSKLKFFNMAVYQAEGELSELLWEAHILLHSFLGLTNFTKLYENTRGISFGKQILMQSQ